LESIITQEENQSKGSKAMRKMVIVLGLIVAVGAILVIQRDFIYGTKGNLGQGTHARF
jgi:hypothetical protein